MHKLALKFHFDWPLHQEVKAADKMNLEYEWDNFMLPEGAPYILKPWPPELAKDLFLEAFHRLRPSTLKEY